MAVSILLLLILSHFAVRYGTEVQERIGCFSFNHDNTLLSMKVHEKIASIAECIHLCQALSATYAGVRIGKQCYCGDSHNHTVNGEQLGDSSCTETCNDHTDRCGGQFSIVIYAVCSKGRYRDNTTAESDCDALCNCAKNHVCLYKNGLCPANCESGWSGDSCNVRVFQTTTKAATPLETDTGVTVTSGASESTNNVAGTDPLELVHPDNTDGISVTAVAVGVSVAVLVVIVIIALIVFIRRRRKPHKSGDEYDEGMTISEVKTDHSTEKQTENGPTIYTATESPEPCYSSVDYLSNGPANNNGEDIPKLDDDVAINGELEMVKYAVVKKPGDEMHLNLNENSLYGTYAGDSDEEGQE